MQGVDQTALRLRIEILEEITRRIGATAAGGGLTSFAGPTVANQAAASALPASTYLTSQLVYTLAQEAIWQYIPGVAGTAGVPPLAADEVIPAAGGVLARTNYSSPKWRIGVNDIYIDPANVAASDENDGFTALTPLKTGMELFRRWGWGSPVIVGPNLATSPDGFLTVHIQTDLVAPDQLPANVIIATNGGLRFKGGPTTIRRTSTFTAVTAMNPAGNTRLRLTDGAFVWTPFLAANTRGRVTTGAAAGGTFQIQTNVGGGAADCSACQTTNEAGFAQFPTTVTPAPGDGYVIENLVQCNFGTPFNIQQQNNDAFGGFAAFADIVDLSIPPVTPGAFFGTAWCPVVEEGTWAGLFLNFYNCVLDRVVDFSSAGSFFTIASYFTDGFINLGANDGAVVGGGIIQTTTTTFPAIIWSAPSLQRGIDSDFVANQTSIFLIGVSGVRNFASWNVAAGAVNGNSGGHGVLVGFHGAFSTMRGSVGFIGTCWGNGNAGVGVLVGAGCSANGAPQVITGTAGDFKLANNLPGAGASQAVYFSGVTSTYLPVGGQATTWALLAAAAGAPGFGGSAHWPDQDSSWNALETTA